MRPMLMSVTQQGTVFVVISGIHRRSAFVHGPRVNRRQGFDPVLEYRRHHSLAARQA